MNNSGRIFGLIIAVAMMVFSAIVYLKTGDWVAIVFLLGSLAYVIVFASSNKKEPP